MNVPAELFYRNRQSPDIEDVAATFVEEEVGRFDWKANWTVYKSKPRLSDRVASWLQRIGYDVQPAALIAEVDRLAASATGRWA